jgi:hypothetical protein
MTLSTTLTDSAIVKLKQMIVSGELAPGDRLPREADLAERLGCPATRCARRSRGCPWSGCWTSARATAPTSPAWTRRC